MLESRLENALARLATQAIQMVRRIGRTALVLLSFILQTGHTCAQLPSSVTPTEFAQRFTRQGGDTVGTNAMFTLELQESEHVKIASGLLSTSSARVNQGMTWLIRGLSGSTKPKLDFTRVISRSSPAVLIASGN